MDGSRPAQAESQRGCSQGIPKGPGIRPVTRVGQAATGKDSRAVAVVPGVHEKTDPSTCARDDSGRSVFRSMSQPVIQRKLRNDRLFELSKSKLLRLVNGRQIGLEP